MKKVVLLFLLVFSNNAFSQKWPKPVASPTYIKSRPAYFYKNTWTPFSGNVKFEIRFKKNIYLAKIKFENGFPVQSELCNPISYQLKYCVSFKKVHGFDTEIYDSINRIPIFNDTDVFTDTIALKKQMVTNYYNRENEVSIPLNGFVKSQNKKTYYKDGMIVKVEHFYDDDCRKIRARFDGFSQYYWKY